MVSLFDARKHAHRDCATRLVGGGFESSSDTLQLEALGHDIPPCDARPPLKQHAAHRRPLHPEFSTLSFGGVVHFCLGAALARAEIGITFRDLFDRFQTIVWVSITRSSGNRSRGAA